MLSEISRDFDAQKPVGRPEISKAVMLAEIILGLFDETCEAASNETIVDMYD